jgi:hypothetical protein
MMNLKKFYFNTGVIRNSPLSEGMVWRNGTKQIPFECKDVPDNATFMFACDNPNLPDSKYENVIVREIYNSTLIAKYAYFRLQFNTYCEICLF